MGGLCVQVSFDGSPVDGSEGRRMAAAADHRGPDGTGTWSGPGALLVHQHHVVLPEDVVDEQPLVRAGLVLVADARIDNAEELVPFLVARGQLADASEVTDAELVLAAYLAWGDSAPERLVGDFAFVVWDQRRRRLFAARDPLGMRPLYYRSEPRRRAMFASEIKQVLAARDVPRQVFEPALAATLAGPLMPPEWTAYDGVEQLAPGRAVAITDAGRRVWPFWRPDPRVRFHGDEADADAAFREVFEKAVTARLRSVHPVGIFLSGGMDSGSVASMAGWVRERSAAPRELRSYSWAFSELPDSDERRVSDHVVRRYGLQATAVPADDGWPLAGYPDHGPDADDPYCWVYQALIERTLDICRADGVGVLLNGDRGDELVGDWVFDEIGLLRAGRPRDAVGDVRAVVRTSGLPAGTALRRRVLRPLVAARLPRVERWQRRRAGQPWPPWVPADFARRVDLSDMIDDLRRAVPFDGAPRTLRHGRIFMPQGARIAVLRERTRARRGMAFADPFSDRRLVELVLSMPQWLVQRREQPKRILRSAMVGVMPEQARTSARKTIPYGLFDRGFTDRALPVVQDLLTESRAAEHGWLDADAALAVHQEYVRTGDSHWDFWWPLTVEMWLRRWWS